MVVVLSSFQLSVQMAHVPVIGATSWPRTWLLNWSYAPGTSWHCIEKWFRPWAVQPVGAEG